MVRRPAADFPYNFLCRTKQTNNRSICLQDLVQQFRSDTARSGDKTKIKSFLFVGLPSVNNEKIVQAILLIIVFK